MLILFVLAMLVRVDLFSNAQTTLYDNSLHCTYSAYLSNPSCSIGNCEQNVLPIAASYATQKCKNGYYFEYSKKTAYALCGVGKSILYMGCVECPIATYKNWAISQNDNVCIACGPNATTNDNRTTCTCDQNFHAEGLACKSCPFGSVWNESACVPCPAGSTPTLTGCRPSCLNATYNGTHCVPCQPNAYGTENCVCAASFFLSQPDTCLSCSSCNATYYVAYPCNGTQNTVCAPCSACAANTYRVAPCNATTDTKCASCSVCNATSYITSPCNSSADTKCASCATCNASSYVASPCNRTSNTMCASCSKCSASSYVTSPCTSASDTVCAACSSCAPSSYMLSPCLPASDAVCAPCAACGPSEYLATACTWAANTVCAACSACGANTYMQSPCNATSNTVCANCTPCAPGTYQTAPCTQTQNTQCAACISVPNSQWTSACNYRCLLNYQLPSCTLIPIDRTVSATLANIDLPSAVCRVPEWTTKLRSFYGARALIVSLADNVTSVSCYPDPCLCSRATRRLLEDPLLTMTFWYEGSNQASSGIQYVIPEITAVSVKSAARRLRSVLLTTFMLQILFFI